MTASNDRLYAIEKMCRGASEEERLKGAVAALAYDLEEAVLEIQRHHRDFAEISEHAGMLEEQLSRSAARYEPLSPEQAHLLRKSAQKIRNIVG